MNSPYQYTSRQIYNFELEKRKKYIKALVYDFLKKHRMLGFYYDCYLFAHNVLSQTPTEIERKKLLPFEVYIKDAAIMASSCGYSFLRDFFWERSISFNWQNLTEKQRGDIVNLDREWTKLIDKEIGK